MGCPRPGGPERRAFCPDGWRSTPRADRPSTTTRHPGPGARAQRRSQHSRRHPAELSCNPEGGRCMRVISQSASSGSGGQHQRRRLRMLTAELAIIRSPTAGEQEQRHVDAEGLFEQGHHTTRLSEPAISDRQREPLARLVAEGREQPVETMLLQSLGRRHAPDAIKADGEAGLTDAEPAGQLWYRDRFAEVQSEIPQRITHDLHRGCTVRSCPRISHADPFTPWHSGWIQPPPGCLLSRLPRFCHLFLILLCLHAGGRHQRSPVTSRKTAHSASCVDETQSGDVKQHTRRKLR